MAASLPTRRSYPHSGLEDLLLRLTAEEQSSRPLASIRIHDLAFIEGEFQLTLY
jgi:hypothetical protein